jgi:hypothetical protein
MPYRSAILAALEDLKDHQTGTPASSVRRRMLDRAAADDGDDAAAAASWSDASFRTSLKSLARDGTLVRVGGGGSNYKFSDARLREMARGLEARAEKRMEATTGGGGRHLADAAAAASVPPAAAPAAAPRDVAAVVVDCDGGRRHRRRQHPREEPPKGSPKRKTFRAKITMADMGDTISAVVPPPRDDTMMETDDDRGAAVAKIVPRRVSPRRMYVDVFRFACVCVLCMFVCTRSPARDWDGYCDNGTSKKLITFCIIISSSRTPSSACMYKDIKLVMRETNALLIQQS